MNNTNRMSHFMHSAYISFTYSKLIEILNEYKKLHKLLNLVPNILYSYIWIANGVYCIHFKIKNTLFSKILIVWLVYNNFFIIHRSKKSNRNYKNSIIMYCMRTENTFLKNTLSTSNLFTCIQIHRVTLIYRVITINHV